MADDTGARLALKGSKSGERIGVGRGAGGWGGRRFAKWKERGSRGRKWWQPEKGVGGLSPQTDAYFVKGHFGGVGGREVKGAEQYWAVGGGASRSGCLRAREQVRPLPRCRQKRLYPLE